MPHTNEVIVFEDYFWHGLGLLVHLFLRDLLEFWGVSLCNLHLNMILHITMPLNTSQKGWNPRWFYMKQSHPAIRCDIDQILENQKSWSEKSTNDDMDQVKELLGMIKGMKMNGVVVVVSFIVRRI